MNIPDVSRNAEPNRLRQGNVLSLKKRQINVRPAA
jgi:hypothetical protein